MVWLWCYYGSHAVETVWPLLIIIIPLGWGVIVLPPHGQINEDHDEITIDERHLTIILIIQCYLTPCLPSYLLDHWMHKVALLGHHRLALLIGHMHGHHELSSQRLQHLLVLLRWHQLKIVLMHQVYTSLSTYFLLFLRDRYPKTQNANKLVSEN